MESNEQKKRGEPEIVTESIGRTVAYSALYTVGLQLVTALFGAGDDLQRRGLTFIEEFGELMKSRWLWLASATIGSIIAIGQQHKATGGGQQTSTPERSQMVSGNESERRSAVASGHVERLANQSNGAAEQRTI